MEGKLFEVKNVMYDAGVYVGECKVLMRDVEAANTRRRREKGGIGHS